MNRVEFISVLGGDRVLIFFSAFIVYCMVDLVVKVVSSLQPPHQTTMGSSPVLDNYLRDP